MTTQTMKDRIDKLVEVFVTYAAGVGSDAGWHGPHRLGLLIEFRGDVPPPGGNDRADVQAIGEIRFLRKQHADFNLACMLLGRLARTAEKHATAMLAEPYLRHVYKRPFADKDVASDIGTSLGSYRHNRKMAYQALANVLELIDDYEQVKAA